MLVAITPLSVDRFRYFVKFIEEHSSHAVVKYMRHKNQALQNLKEYITDDGTLSILLSNNGTENKNESFNHFCTNNKIKRDSNVPETPEQNGVAERYTRSVVKTAQSHLIGSKRPQFFWLRAVDTAAYVRDFVRRDKTEKN